jgi:alpha-tubulin suppressor-like RCC1 family protein
VTRQRYGVPRSPRLVAALSAVLTVLLVACADPTGLSVTHPDGVVAVSAGGSRTCAITQDRSLYCWGHSVFGGVFEPARVSGIPGVAKAISVSHGLTCVLTEDGSTHCWGQLGSPARVGGPAFSAVVVAAFSGCGLTGSGEAYCWGSNMYGSVGDGTTEDRAEPVPVATSARFTQLSAGDSHMCAVRPGGEALCWGRNSWGVIGDGTVDNVRVDPTPVAGGNRYRSVHSGGNVTCAVTEQGSAHCWGLARLLGDGTQETRPIPGPVAGGHRFRTLAAGNVHACGLTLEGTAYCWGRNGEGQLGTGTREDALIPTRVNTTERFADLAAGAHHTCGVTPAGVAFCWGYNGDGQLGTGRVTMGWNTPVPVRW